MEKHTKGPWAVSYSSSHSSHQTFDVDMRNPKHEEKEANAKLIAAAPELLEALIEAKNELMHHVMRLNNESIFLTINNAIGKATE